MQLSLILSHKVSFFKSLARFFHNFTQAFAFLSRNHHCLRFTAVHCQLLPSMQHVPRVSIALSTWILNLHPSCGICWNGLMEPNIAEISIFCAWFRGTNFNKNLDQVFKSVPFVHKMVPNAWNCAKYDNFTLKLCTNFVTCAKLVTKHCIFS
jgi:hypothetical protein